VTASLLAPGPGAWDGAWAPKGDPAALAKPCYERALEADPDLAGTVWIEIRIGSSGTRASLRDTTPMPLALASCIEAAMRMLRAPDGISEFPVAFVYLSLTPD
jgi:hypothetical protein